MQFCIDDFLVAYRVNCAVHVRDVLIVEAAQHMYYGIRLTNVSEEFVAQSLALAGTLHQSGDVHNLACGGHDASRMNYFGKTCKSFVGHGYHANIRFYCTEREVCRLRLCARQTVEKGGLAHVGQPHNTTF